MTTLPSPLIDHSTYLQRLCTAKEMRAMDHHAIEKIGIPGMVLMENAARSVVDWLENHSLLKTPQMHIVVCCGKGNNGGDGYAVARLLKNRGYDVMVIDAGPAKSDDAQTNQNLWNHFGERVECLSEKATLHLKKADIIIDAIFGTGLEREIEGKYKKWIEIINQNTSATKIGVDIPSGVHSDHGQIMGTAVQCQHTITFQVGKNGCYQYPGLKFAGNVIVTDISIPPQWPSKSTPSYLLTQSYIQKILPTHRPDAHKGTFGHLLTICGSAGMAGASFLASYAALKSGCGLVSACVPPILQDAFLSQSPELMTVFPKKKPETHFSIAHIPFVLSELEKRDSVVLGCGLGQNLDTIKFVQELILKIEKPLLIDADGLNSITGRPSVGRPSAGELLKQRTAPTIITPHPKELSRLCGLTTTEIQKNRIEVARKYAKEWNVILLLKGAYTVISDPNGHIFINPTGNEGMAKGGSGDVLSGIIGSFLAQNCTPLEATLIGAYLHGLAGDVQRKTISVSHMSALNLIHGLNEASLLLEELEDRPTTPR